MTKQCWPNAGEITSPTVALKCFSLTVCPAGPCAHSQVGCDAPCLFRGIEAYRAVTQSIDSCSFQRASARPMITRHFKLTTFA